LTHASLQRLAWDFHGPLQLLAVYCVAHAKGGCSTHKLATADAIIFATARVRGATLLTCDAHFDGLRDVILIVKASV